MCWQYRLFSLILLLCLPWVAWTQLLPRSPLRNFQVSQPLPVPDTENCEIVLIHHLFSNSFGQPAVVQYNPPTNCGLIGTWAAIVLNITATSNGKQFDRLANLYLAGVEIWRTSTPEPTPEGIIWTTLKDVSRYTPLFAQNGTLLLDLGNLLDAGLGLTGEYDVMVTGRFFPSNDEIPAATTADVILPLSRNSSTQGSAFFIPPAGDAFVPVLPRNIAQAFVEIYASGNANEEFWYGNIPDEFFPQLPPWNAPDGQANPKGPFREVQLLIDGVLAGVVFPYPVIYSGEFLPSLWRPMLSYGAFDSPTYYIDITPFVPSLCNEQPHNFTLNVAGMGTDFSINQNWIVSGNLQLLLDESDEATTGELTIHEASPFITPSVVGFVEGPAPNVSVTTTANRTIHIQGNVRTGSGKVIKSIWRQQLTFSSIQEYSTTPNNISRQHVTQLSRGSSVSMHNDAVAVFDSFTYPLDLKLNFSVLPSPADQTFFDYGVVLQHSYQRAFSQGSMIGGIMTDIDTTQTCEGAEFEHQANVTIRTGRTREQFSYVDALSRTFFRDVEVATLVNITTGLPSNSSSSLIFDHQSGSLA